jgi:hypothetical protein
VETTSYQHWAFSTQIRRQRPSTRPRSWVPTLRRQFVRSNPSTGVPGSAHHGEPGESLEVASPSSAEWMLSALPRRRPNCRRARWRGLRAGGLKGLIQLPPLPLKQPEPMNEEGLVVEGQHFWEASEGKQHPAQRAALLRSDMAAGSLLSSQELPPDWRLQPDRGLRSNGGPESLSRLPVDGALLMAAEKPLLQDPPDCVRLLRWKLDTSGALHPAELSPLALPPGGWGLADLLARLLPKPWASGPADRCVNSSYCRIAPLAARYKLRPARGWLSAIAACCRRSSVVG